MASLSNIDPVLLNPSITASPTTNQFISQDGSIIVDGNSVPADGSLTPVQVRSSVQTDAMQVDIPSAPLNATLASELHAVPANYAVLKVDRLKAQCKARKLKVGGRKSELVSRLENDDRRQISSTSPTSLPPPSPNPNPTVTSTVTTIHTNAPSEPSGQGSHQSQVGDVHRASTDPVEINSTQVLAESAALERYFENGLMRENGANKEDESEDEEDEEEAAEIDNEDELQAVDNSRTHDALAWADKFILETRRKGGRQTENSVLKLWMSWASIAINSGQLPDIIVDAKHMIAYLKYAATRQLFTRRGENKSTSSRLSAASFKKIMTMLGRVRRRQEDENPDIKISRPSKDSRTQDFYKAVMVQAQRIRLESEDFDITKGTILDSELRPEHFNEITSAIFEKLDQLPSIIKAHFSWTWQCSTLNRSDELVSLLMACIQPFSLRLPDYTDHNGRISPLNRQALGVLAMFHETKTAQPGKTEPKYSFVLPHRDPLRCPVGALAILLHFMFDQEDLMSRVSPWDWENAATWRKVHVLFGRTVDQAVTGDAIGRMYGNFLSHTSITSKKRTHLPRRSFPTVLEEMGVPADQVDATGHWQGNTRREIYGSKIPKASTVALAGFPVGETYFVPWAKVQVPDALQKEIFPFCEGELARLRVRGCKNQGTINFLELLQHLRPFFWRAISCIRERFPDSRIIKQLPVLSRSDAQSFLQQWPDLRRREEAVNNQSSVPEKAFHETPTRNAFSSFAAQLHGMNQQLSVLTRRTEPLSPSKRSAHPNSDYLPLLTISPRNLFPSSTPILPTSTSSSPSPPSTPSNSSQSVEPRPSLQSAQAQIAASETFSSSNVLSPTTISASNQHIYRVLPLSPSATLGQSLIHTSHDLILPPLSAFLSSTYPAFTTVDCTWQYVFDRVVNPSPLWSSYAPGSLGDYPDVKSLWQAWDEGTYVKDIGRKPALRLIDARWGNLESQETHRRKFPSWRPRNDDKARKIWSNFYFFIHRIDSRMKSGHSSDEAVVYFEGLRGGKSLSQLHKSLQTKKRKRRMTDDESS